MGTVYIEPDGDESPGCLHTDSYAKLRDLVDLYYGWPPVQRTILGPEEYQDIATAGQASIIAASIDVALPDIPREDCLLGNPRRHECENPLLYWSGRASRKWLRKLARACHLGAVDFYIDVRD